MYDRDIEERIRSGAAMVTWGIVVLVAAFLGMCVAAANNAGEPNAAAQGFEIGQSPWLLIALAAGTALITVGQVKKSNARRDAEARFVEANTRVDVVLDEAAPDGPFRGDMKEVEVVDPVVAAGLEAERQHEHRRGNTNLAIGGTILVVTVVGMLYVALGDSDADPREKVENTMVALGLAVFPFGFGLFFTIRGLVQRSK